MSETLATTLIERLEDVRCDREPFTNAHKHCICRLTNEAAREISRLQSRIEELKRALKPFAEYAKAREAMPLRGMGDSVHSIHPGTEWEAEITFTHCIEARSVLEASNQGGE